MKVPYWKILSNHDLYKMGEYNSEKKKISGVVVGVKNCWIFDTKSTSVTKMNADIIVNVIPV